MMKNLLLFFLTCVIATGALLSAATMKNPWPSFIVGFGVWLLFIFRIAKR
jgi:ABC-type transport system involved in multi-copper enzyme maturation permease subunit